MRAMIVACLTLCACVASVGSTTDETSGEFMPGTGTGIRTDVLEPEAHDNWVELDGIGPNGNLPDWVLWAPDGQGDSK